MMKSLMSAAVLFVALPAFSQMGPGGSGMEHGPMGFGAMQIPVTNAPYSATFISTTTEKLQDGTVLNRSNTRVVERDSMGRTREEMTMPSRGGDAAISRTMIVIVDPVAHTMTQLRADQKVAMVLAMRQPEQRGHDWRRGPAGAGTASAQSGAAASGVAENPHTRHEDKNVMKTDLGAKTIAGVVANGTRITRTIPVGEVGNAAPVVSTHEEWFSPDLKIELSRTDADPFRGTRTMTVSALSKAEPAAALFQVPSGYTTQQASGHSGNHRGFGGPRGGGEMPPPLPDGAAPPQG